MKARTLFVVAVSLFTLTLASRPAHAQGTTFTYQGQLSSSGAPANGSFDLRFGLYTNVSIGSQVGNFLTNAAVGVTNGVFTTSLNFSNVFNGTTYFLDIGVRTNGSTGAFTPLTPRQSITPVPYAITASNLTGTLPATQLSGTLPASVLGGAFSNSVSFTNTANVFAGNGSGLTNVPGVTGTNFVYAYDSSSQFVASAGAFQNITLATSSVNGWFVPASGEFVAGQTGTYLVQYQARFANGASSGNTSAGVRAVVNLTSSPVELTGSEAIVYVPPFCVEEASRSFLISLTAGQMLSFQMTGSSAGGTGGTYLISSSFFGQFFPSFTVTIVRIL